MTFWQENYSFIKEVYDTRYAKMVEWMDNVEMAIQKVCASRVYTSAEFKREKDNFHVKISKLHVGVHQSNVPILFPVTLQEPGASRDEALVVGDPGDVDEGARGGGAQGGAEEVGDNYGAPQGTYPPDPGDTDQDRVLLEVLLLRGRPLAHL